MATVLLTWEIGAGLGHFMNLRPVAEGLARRGHRVMVALRDLSQARTFFTHPQIQCLQAPTLPIRSPQIEPICTFAQILYESGFGDVNELETLADAWRHIYEYVKPDLIVFDHSPVALLAARGLSARRALIGTGFFSPPDITPLPNLRTWLKPDWNRMLAHEKSVLDHINTVLERCKKPPIERVAGLFRDADQDFLLTFRELDCYPSRGPAEYFGMWWGGMGQRPQWPSGRGPKIFAYLKPFASLPAVLQLLRSLRTPTLVYIGGGDKRLWADVQCLTLRIADSPIEMSQAARECDLAILNGTPATAIAMLIAGKPALHIPIYLDQGTIAFAVQRIGAGRCVSLEPAEIHRAFDRLLSDRCFSEAAAQFAAQYRDFDPNIQIERIVNRAEALAMAVG